MKNSIKYYIQSLILVSLFLLSSCEKGIEEVEYEGVIYIPQSGLSEVMPLLGESSYQLGVYKSGINDNSSPKVRLDVDQSLLDDFLASNPTYEMLPAQYYEIPNNEVNFSEGDNRVFLNIQFKNIGEDYTGKSYILPIRISDVDGGTELMPEKSSVLLHVSRYRNVYEGEFRALGTSSAIADPDDSKKVDQMITATSVSANTIQVPGPENGMLLHLKISGNSVSVSAAPGSEHFMIVNDSSTINGEFDETYQRFKGKMHLGYKYTINDKEMYADIDLTFNL